MEKKIYTLKDGGVFSATSHSDLVTQMRSSSMFDESTTNYDYMKSFSTRFVEQEGILISYASENEFVQALIDCQFIE